MSNMIEEIMKGDTMKKYDKELDSKDNMFEKKFNRYKKDMNNIV